MELTELEGTWAALGESDPLWAVLSDPRFKDGRWDVEEFFATGDREIEATLEHLAELGQSPHRGVCLEFGCGVGRCSNGLAGWFPEYHGVDISQSMLALARQYHDEPRFHYHHHGSDDLEIFADERFDFVYSRLVLQHIPPEHAARYISEFLRVLRPGGVAVFQVPGGIRGLDPGAYAARLQLEAGPSGLVGAPKASGTGPSVDPLQPAQHYQCSVAVTNASGSAWPGNCVSLGNHWLAPDGGVVQLDDGRAILLDDLEAGSTAVVDLRVTAPASSGRYLLELDLVQEGVTWFADRGSTTARVPLTVGQVPPTASARQFGRRLRGLLGLTRPPTPAGPADVEAPAAQPAGSPSFEMHCVPKDQVLELVSAQGGQVVEVVEDGGCGGGWISYQYTVVKPRT